MNIEQRKFVYFSDSKHLIGFSGKAGSGKDTAALALTDYDKMSFAHPVYLGVEELNPLFYAPGAGTFVRVADHVRAFGWEKTKENPEIRRLLQAYGTEAGRDIHGPDCWINIAKKYMQERRANEGLYYKDVRFDNEAEVIREHGGINIRIVGPSRRAGVNTSHSSEAGIRDSLVDYVIYNTGTVEQLHQYVLLAVAGGPTEYTKHYGDEFAA